MTEAEVLRDETEQKMLYRFLDMIRTSEDLEDLEQQIRIQIKEPRT